MKLKHYLIYIASAILLFHTLTVVYFSPEFFENKTIAQDDILRYEGMAKQTIDFNKKNDEPTLWTSAMFGGFPVYLFQAEFSDQPLKVMDWAFKGFLQNKKAHGLFMTMFCFFLAMLCFEVNPILAIFGAIGFGLSSYNLVLIDVGHITKLWAIAYSPLILGGMFLVFRQKYWLGFAVFTLALTLQIRANHVQITYYLAFVALFFLLFEVIEIIKKKDFRQLAFSIAIFGGGAILALGASAGRLLTTLDYMPYSIRGKAELTPLNIEAVSTGGLDRDYAFQWSQGIGETFTLLIPNLYGGSNNEQLPKTSAVYQLLQQAGYSGADLESVAQNAPFLYWGDQPFTNAPIYAGAISCFLFVLGFFILEKRQKYWLLGGVLITFFFAWGKNFETFNYLMFDYFPYFNKFRSVSMALSLSVLLIGMGAVLSLSRLLEMEWSKELFKQIGIAFGLTGGLAFLLAILGGSLLSFSGMADGNYPEQLLPAILADRQSFLRVDAFRSFIFIGLAVIVLYLFFQKKLSKNISLLLLILLISVDVWGVGKRYLNAADFEKNLEQTAHVATDADQVILKDKSLNYRVLNLANPFNDAETSYFHKSVGGYFPAKPRRYQDMIERQIEPQMQQLIADFSGGKPNFENYHILNMLNTKYIKFGSGAKEVLQNPANLGSAWFVQKLTAVNSADEEMKALDKLNTAQEAVFDAKKFEKISPKTYQTDSTASVKLVDYSPKYLKYACQTNAVSLLVMSENYYPKGWIAKLDGKEVPYFSVNYILRAIEVPAGKHSIEFVFEPQIYQTGRSITQISAILVGLLVVSALGLAFWKNN